MNRADCAAHPKLTYDDEIALVRDLVETDPSHALHHCVSALGLAPERTEWHAPLRTLLDDEAVAAKLDGDDYFGAHAARAFRLHAEGDAPKAIAIIAQVFAAMPHLGFDRWLVTWLEEMSERGEKLDANLLMPALVLTYSFGIGRIRLLPSERAAAEELAELAELAMGLSDDPRLPLLTSAALRRAGRYEDAIRAAEHGQSGEPTEMALIAKGLAQRGAGQFEAALETFDRALEMTGDSTHIAEKYRVLADAGRWDEAIALWHERAKEKQVDPENEAELAALEQAAKVKAPPLGDPPLDRVRRMLLGHGALVAMSDATANALRQVGADAKLREKGPVGAGDSLRAGKINMAVAGYEGPSNRLCLALMLAGEPDLKLANYTMTTPHILRRVKADEGDAFATWTLDGEVPVQALAPPSAAVSDWVEQVALAEPGSGAPAERFASSASFIRVWNNAKSTPPPKARARDWVAATVYPRMPVFRVASGPDWIYLWQVAALVGLVSSEEGWKGTEKREALLSLLRGTIDWPLAAAIRVAAEVALFEPEALSEIRLELLGLVDALANEPNVALGPTLYSALGMLPLVPKHFLEKLANQIAAENAPVEEEEEAAAPAAPAPAPATSKKPWWKIWG